MNPDDEIAIRFDRVSKQVGAKHLLTDLSFEVPRGTAFSILGRRGAGKTVTLKLANGLMKPDQGRIFLNGNRIDRLASTELLRARKSTGFVFQSSAVFDSISVAENVAFPLRYGGEKTESEVQEIVHTQLVQVGLQEECNTMPVHLSFGMRKLLAFARALACDPSILLLDDPWNGMDAITAVAIRNLLRDLRQRRRTTLLIADNNFAEVRDISDRLAILEGGRVIACDSPEALARCTDPLIRQFVTPQDP